RAAARRRGEPRDVPDARPVGIQHRLLHPGMLARLGRNVLLFLRLREPRARDRPQDPVRVRHGKVLLSLDSNKAPNSMDLTRARCQTRAGIRGAADMECRVRRQQRTPARRARPSSGKRTEPVARRARGSVPDMTPIDAVETLDVGGVVLEGHLAVPDGARGIVLFAHGSGSSRHSPRNRAVAELLRGAGLGTLLLDLLTAREEKEDAETAHLRF